MSKIAKISVIPKQYSVGKTFEYALSQHGWSRMPGTGVTLFPFRENNGTFRTALDPQCVVYLRIQDKTVKESKQKAAEERRKRLEEATKLELGAHSSYYNFGGPDRRKDGSPNITVQPYKLIDGDNIFDLDDPAQAITYAWLSVHPRIASSLQAYNNGEYPSDTQFYVKDEEVEAELLYAKKKEFNNAIVKFSSFSPDKKKKIARLCDLPAYDDTREELVYNMMDDFLNQKQISVGAFKGQSGLRVFNLYADLDDNSLYIKDLIEQAFKNQIYRLKNHKIFEGEQEVYKSREDLTEFLLDENNQDDVLALEKKLKMKKLASV
jgi:hypothetical protein